MRTYSLVGARFLEQNDGVLSRRALKKEFVALKEEETNNIEANFKDIFSVD